MALDTSYYCDFSKEIPLNEWEFLKDDGKTFSMKIKVTTKGGDFLFLSSVSGTPSDPYRATIKSISCNGKKFLPNDRLGYVTRGALRQDCPITLPEGEVELFAEGLCGNIPQWKELLNCALSRPMEKVKEPPSLSRKFKVEEESYPETAPLPDLSSFIPGIGTADYKGPGRFGFTKGDGVLDCAMPSLGNIDKLYLLGHPEYKKTFRWNYSTLPPGAPRHGSYAPGNHSVDDDRISITHLSTHWEADIKGERFACTYSLASPGIITERESGIMELSDLEFAGNYQYILIPRKDGELEVTSLRDVKNLEMGENFLLLFGCTEFPDLPLLLVFQEKPGKDGAFFRSPYKPPYKIILHQLSPFDHGDPLRL